MAPTSTRHSHSSIADHDAVRVLLGKISAVDEKKLLLELDCAARRYNGPSHQAFFHGLLTGYAVGLKHK